MSRHEDQGLSGPMGIPRRADGAGPAPLTFGQEVIWLLDRAEPGTVAYNVPRAFRVAGELDLPALRSALDAVVERHEVLRTTFAERDGVPVQVVHPTRAVALEVADLRSEEGSVDPQAVERALLRRARRPFDLTRDLLLRPTLLQVGPGDQILLLESHHIATDGWSKGVMLRDLSSAYAAARAGKNPALAPLPIRFQDFAAWQRTRTEETGADSDMAYWTEALAGGTTGLELPTDRPRPAYDSFEGGRQSRILNAGVTEAIQALSRRQGTTLFMTLLAAWQSLLHRYTGQTDILTGSPVAGRDDSALDEVLGFFTNTLPLRSRFEDDPTFAELLARVRTTTLAALEHQTVPFEQLASALNPGRRGGAFQAVFMLERDETTTIQLGNAALTAIPFDPGWAKFDLALAVLKSPAGLRAEIQYREDRFDRATVDRMLEQFEILLAGVAAAPEQRISALPMLPPWERERLLHDWNPPESSYPVDRCVHQLIAEQAALRPEAIAVSCGAESLSYAELEARSNRLAHRLVRMGVSREQVVGVYLLRSPALLVSLLAIWKAGAAYLPLDPAYPRDRIRYMLEDGSAKLVVTQDVLRADLPAEVAQLSIDEATSLPDEAATRLAVRPDARVRAYLIYTSGSTGRPKGVEIEHQALVNFLWSMRELLGVGPSDTLLGVTTLGFDIAGLECYLPLITGGRVVLASRDTAIDARRLATELRASGATVMQATPTTWRMLLDDGWAGEPGLLALCGGEALSPSLAARLIPRVRELWNLYGPTETTIWSTAGRVEPQQPIRLGRAIANTVVRILDANRRLQPIGVPGELYIGGAGLARGYFHRPELTTERFVPDPYGPPESRLYRTGDRARWRADGSIEYLGRLDTQVKLRGHRIELGEIESALTRVPGIGGAVAAVREDGQGETWLVAYLTAAAGQDVPRVAEIRARLEAKLPAAMVPQKYMTLQSFPVTPNGKVDRAALPAPETRAEPAATDERPRSSTETRLAALWSDLLKLDTVGVQQDFFLLGGHSVLAMRLLGRIAAEFGVRLPLRTIFDAPTIERLAPQIDAARPALDSAAALEEELAAIAELSEAEVRHLLGTEDSGARTFP